MKIREEYNDLGVEGFYLNKGDVYDNPHKSYIEECLSFHWKDNFKKVLDLGCGDGLVSKYIKKRYKTTSIYGCDAYMKDRYEKETGNKCYSYSFEDIAKGVKDLPEVDIIVISYAIDLLDRNYLNNFLYCLSLYSNKLLIIRPNKHTLPELYWKEKERFFFSKSKSIIYEKR